MATVDDRVVAMSFENSKFESGVSQSMSTLDKLKNSLKFTGATKGLDEVEKRAGRMDLTGISNSLNSLQNKFSGLGLAATAAFATVVQQATQAGMRMARAFTLDPVTAGFQNYETQIQAVQTIMANTGLTGKAGLGQINSALSELNTYANQTIYNFSEMARNIGTFTAAGVDLKTATGAIKGIANLAAASGSTSQQASTAMYQLSQAIAAGKVSLQDWNSVVNAGMGGTMFQKALANTAEAMGTLGKGSVKLVGPMKQLTINGESFRNAIQAKPGQKSWLTSDVLTTALKEFTGDMSKAQLAAIGFNEEQIKAIQTQAKTAVNAATQIKTATQMFQALKEEVATAWSAVFKTIFGGIGGATKLFTSLHTTIQNALTNPIIHFNKVLGEWDKLGGKKDFFSGIKSAARDLEAVLRPIKGAFRDIFPAATGRSLAEASKNFHKLMDTLRPSIQTVGNLHRTFRGVFAIFDIGRQVISGIIHFFGLLFGDIRKGAGGISAFTGNIGDAIYAFDQWLKKGHGITDFFDELAQFIQPVTHWLGQFATNMGHASNAVAGSVVVTTATNAWHSFLGALQKVGHFLQPAVDAITGVFSKTADLIGKALKSQNYDKIFGILQTTLIGGLILAIKKAIGGGINIDFGKNAFRGLTGSLETLQGTLKSLQTNIKAQTIYTIAKAIALLAGAVLLLSIIPAKKMQAGMTAVAIGLGELMAALALMSRTAVGGFVKAPVIAAGLIEMAVAVDIISVAIAGLGFLSWERLEKGLAGVGGALLALSLASIPLQAAGPRMAIAAAGVIPLAIGLSMLTGAVALMGHMNVGTLVKGILGSAAALMALGRAVLFVPITLPVTAAGIFILATGLNVLAGAISAMGHMNMGTLTKGVLGAAAALMAIGRAMAFMPITLPVTAAGLVGVAIALNIIAGAVSLMGHMGLGTIEKGLIGIGGAMVILSLGLKGMTGALPGAAALLAVGAAMTLFVPALGLLGQFKITTILKGLGAMAAALLLFGGLGKIVAPGLIALATGLGALGLAMVAVGAAVYLIGAGVALLANKGVKGVAAFVAALTALIAVLPSIIINFIKGLVQVVGTVAELAPKVVSALVVIVGQLLDGLVKLSPKLAAAVGALIAAFITVLDSKGPDIIAAGFRLFMHLLDGLVSNIGPIVTRVATIIVRFLNALASHIGDIITAGANLLVKLMEGLANNAAPIVKAAFDVVTKFIGALATNIGRLIESGANFVVKVLEGLGNKKSLTNIGNAVVSLIGNIMDTFAKKLPELAGRAFDALHGFLWNLGWIARNKTPEIVQDFVNLGIDIVKGLSKGIGKAAVDLATSPFEIIGNVLDGMVSEGKKKLGISSPSRVFMEIGGFIVQGLGVGIKNNAHGPVNAASNMFQAMVDTVNKMSSDIDGHVELRPTITPVMNLDQVKKDSQKLKGMTDNVVPITTAKSYKQAASISVSKSADVASVVKSPDDHDPRPPVFKFEQHNYSPEALSEREIYRQTHNQLSQAKNALKM